MVLIWGCFVNLKTTIPTTPEVQRFNAAVERADQLLDFEGDRLTVRQLTQVLLQRAFYSSTYRDAALDLGYAEAALAGDPGDVPGACEHRWRLTGYAKDGTGFVKCGKCGQHQEV